MSDKPFSAAAERNRAPIGEVLRAALPERGRLLEIGSGTGQHALWLCERLPGWRWQPSEHPDQLRTIRAGLVGHALDNLVDPIALDVRADWPDGPFDAVFAANTAHIMHWPAVEAMFAGVARVLDRAGRFLLYGPFMRAGEHNAPGNAQFDQSLRQRDPGMGIRDLDDLDALAARHGLTRIAELAMPANNHTLIFEFEDSLP